MVVRFPKIINSFLRWCVVLAFFLCGYYIQYDAFVEETISNKYNIFDVLITFTLRPRPIIIRSVYQYMYLMQSIFFFFLPNSTTILMMTSVVWCTYKRVKYH